MAAMSNVSILGKMTKKLKHVVTVVKFIILPLLNLR